MAVANKFREMDFKETENSGDGFGKPGTSPLFFCGLTIL